MIVGQTVSSFWVYFCFFLSGFNALIYEVSWLNRIQLIMGHTVYSLATTLAAYLGGLAFGALYAQRLKKEGQSAFSTYLMVELLVGLYGILFYPLLLIIQTPYGWIAEYFQFSIVGLSLVQFVFCTILIFIPTFLMGTTLPLLSSYLYPSRDELSEKLPTLYGINTFGAMVGSFASGYFILPIFGYFKTTFIASAINLGIYFMMSMVSGEEISRLSPVAVIRGFFSKNLRGAKSITWQKTFQRISTEKTKFDFWAFVILFFSGLASMIIQMLWGRLAAMAFGPSVYIFPLVTCIVLAGIGLGSGLWQKANKNRNFSSRFVVALPLLAGLLLLAGSSLFTQTPRLELWWHEKIFPGYWVKTFLEFLTASICFLPAATFLGALFPAAVSQITQDQENDEAIHSLSVGFFLNILGLICGALIGSFILLPELGIEYLSYALALGLVALSTSMAFDLLRSNWVAVCCFLLGVISYGVVPEYDWNLLTSGYFYFREKQVLDQDLTKLGWVDLSTMLKNRKSVLLARQDDPHATISIHQGIIDPSTRLFKVNGKVDGTNASDLKTTRLLSAFPALVKPHATHALIIGIGTGSTAAQTLKYPEMKSVEVVEISKAMLEFAKKYFAGTDGDTWSDPRFRTHLRDGRDFLEHSKEKYDLIISEPSNPWVDGVASLFTEEFYQALANRLEPEGVASLWFHSYGLDCEGVHSVLKAMSRVFKSLLVFKQGGDLFALGSMTPDGLMPGVIPMGAQKLSKILFEETYVDTSLSEVDQYADLLRKTLLYDLQGIQKWSDFAPINTDDNQFLQYRSGRTYFSGMTCEDFSGAGGLTLVQKYSKNFLP